MPPLPSYPPPDLTAAVARMQADVFRQVLAQMLAQLPTLETWRLLSPANAAELLDVHRDTIYELCAAGELETVKVGQSHPHHPDQYRDLSAAARPHHPQADPPPTGALGAGHATRLIPRYTLACGRHA